MARKPKPKGATPRSIVREAPAEFNLGELLHSVMREKPDHLFTADAIRSYVIVTYLQIDQVEAALDSLHARKSVVKTAGDRFHIALENAARAAVRPSEDLDLRAEIQRVLCLTPGMPMAVGAVGALLPPPLNQFDHRLIKRALDGLAQRNQVEKDKDRDLYSKKDCGEFSAPGSASGTGVA
jgi:hypothetical protein